ncbi:MAG: hypothetical protein JNM75_04945 [Rhodospirillales bacterium]|nr:hypothetical protein [Rhodospirillales bacterium]
MKRLVLAAAFAAFAGFAAAPAYAYHCPQDMAQIDAALAKNPNLSPEQLAKVKSLRAEGEQLHKAGNHDASLEALGQAKQILGIQ